MTFWEFLAALLVILAIGAVTTAYALACFAAWLNGTFSQQDAADEQAATMEAKE